MSAAEALAAATERRIEGHFVPSSEPVSD